MRIDKNSFLRDLKDMKMNCIKTPDYDPTNDISAIIMRHNIELNLLRRKVLDALTLRQR